MNDKYTYTLGFDISKDTVDFSLLKSGNKLLVGKLDNQQQGFEQLQQQLLEHGIKPKEVLCCLEHTGIYTYQLLLWLEQEQYPTWVENPLAIKKSLGITRGKNDRIDAERIACYAFRFWDKAQLWKPKKALIEHLQRLVALRNRLLKGNRQLNVPLKESKALIDPREQQATEALCNPVLKELKSAIEQAEKQIKELIDQDEEVSHQEAIISSVPGVGAVTASQLLIVTHGFERITTAKACACYAGVAPFVCSSGTSVRGRSKVSPLANKELKRLLHMCALVAIKCCSELSSYYHGKLQADKSKMPVLNAVRNKLLLRIYACLREERYYEASY
ncbi:MAG: IS110 family transposase [Roseivirga sp.]